MPILSVSKRGSNASRLAAMLMAFAWCAMEAHAQPLAARMGAGDQLIYSHDEYGNHIPDFSHCGYAGADQAIPDVPIRAIVEPGDGDDGRRIQAAIDSVSELAIGADGFRGAVLLSPGQFEVAGQLRIGHSGVVLRGSGAGDKGTTLLAVGIDRRPLLRIEGNFDRQTRGNRQYQVTDEYVAVGARELRVDPIADLKVGDHVLATRPSTAEWIKSLNMDAFGVAWKPGTRDIRWDRSITRVDGDKITLDAPITTAIEKRFGGGTVEPYDWPGRISRVGVEDLRLHSAHDVAQVHDENHAWFGITVQNAQNAWIRRVEFRHFAGGAVSLWENTKHITVEDCISLNPTSEVGGYRRHTFFVQGQLALFLRCWSERGQHDFAIGHCAAGPNAFVNCYAADALGDSGPIESWASGALYDNVRIEGAGLNLENRWINPPGAGWAAANCVLWQCQAATMRVFRPPTANNWAIGVWAGASGEGTFQARGDYVRPISLYQGQLSARRGAEFAAHLSAGLVDPIGSTNPTIAQAAKFTEQSKEPKQQLIDVIRDNFKKSNLDHTAVDIKSGTAKDEHSPVSSLNKPKRLAIKNGWLVVDGALKTGGLIHQGFWRGTIRPDEARNYGLAITRFVPGRTGTGFTDDLNQLVSAMQSNGIAGFDHHYGLWYDRRRDDHTMVRQANGDVAPPFYEQPFARSGTGRAWDGLSKYDLTEYNPWYWQRLHDFAQLCDDSGLLLIHQNYFQHNILEAGAHWADCPWRPANNINDTGLPEPPPYIGDKRIFLADQFYDVTDPRRRRLHRTYIRKCLDNFKDRSNVIQMTSAEYSGPLEFTRFWLDTIIEWQREHDRDVLVAISAPKNVQDAILNDPVRSQHVDIVDIRYWAYTAGNELYAPAGGQNLAPRQHLRQTTLKPGGAAAVIKAVHEYRTRFPNKAVTYNAALHCPSIRDGAAVLIAGGSLPNVKLPGPLAKIMPSMKPAESSLSAERQWCLADVGSNYLIYVEKTDSQIQFVLPNEPAHYRVHWIDSKTGNAQIGETTASGNLRRLRAKTNLLWLERVKSE